MNRSFLLTGGAGFLGRHISKALLERGHAVRVLDNLSGCPDSNLNQLMSGVDFRKGDIVSADDVRDALEGIDIVVHLAAHRTQESWNDPLLTHRVNCTSTLSLLTLARESSVTRLVYASTAAVYGDSQVFPQNEDHIVRPASPYALSKLSAENYCRFYADTNQLETVSLRYFNVFGPGQNRQSRYSGVITAFISSLLEDKPCPIFGSGLQARDFIYIDDAVAATLAACELPGISGQVINVGSGQSHTILELAERLGALLGRNRMPRHLEPRFSDIARSQADISRLITVLKSKPLTEFDRGLKSTATWFTKTRSKKPNHPVIPFPKSMD
ncbi:MAG: NAD-dependent epimerase/dehydratase family protein [Thermoleophilia bacterium]